jgi:FixJ family two-component response regulator
MLVAATINEVFGAELGISTRTVESHRAPTTMGKLGVDSLSDIFKLVFAAEGEEEKQF